MSWHRKVKSIYSISLVTISFIIWSTLSKLLFESPVDYKLFLITLCIVFFTQYLNTLKLKKSLFILFILVLSAGAPLIFFRGQIIVINAIFLIFMALVTYTLENSPVDHTQYKQDIRKSILALGVIWLISFNLGSDFVNEMYRFHILYIIMVIILMRETRGYVYSVKSNTSMVTNIIIGISVVTLSLDFASNIIAKVLGLLMDLTSFILVIIISMLIKIFGGPISFIAEKLRQLLMKSDNKFITEGTTMDMKVNKPPNMVEYHGINLPPELLLIIKILILLVILYAIYKILSRFRNETKIYDGYSEKKEKIIKKKNKKHWVKDMFAKIFQGGGSNREKILSIYKAFEKTTEQADIYKPYMTATQLKNVTKINVNNCDDLEEMTQVYNEAKFSMHEMTQEKVEKVKKGHSNIKKKL